MRKWNKTSLLFMAAASVYPVGALLAAPGDQATGSKPAQNDVRLLEEAAANPAAGEEAKAADAQAVADAKPAAGTSASAPTVNVNDAGTVEIHVNDANVQEVLRMLSMQTQKNIIASKEVRGTVTANLYNVTMKEALENILKANGFGYREKGNFIYVYSAKELAEIEKSERQRVSEVFRLKYATATNAVAMIKPVLSTEGAVSFTIAANKGIGSDTKDAGGDAHAAEDVIVVNDYPEQIEKVKKVLAEVDRRPQQVLVEATIVAARLSEDNALGVDFNVVGGIDFAEIVHQVAGAGQITGANLPTDSANAAVVQGRAHSVGSGNSFSKKVGPNGFKVGYVTDNISVFLAALEEVSDTNVLANPKVLTLNKQRGEVLVGREDGYLTTTVTDTTTVQTVEFLKTGTRLIFRPYIGDDGYVRMEVHPEDSDGQVVNGLPTKSTTEVTTNILVKDGHTVVIGGLFREVSGSSKSQVPGLGNLPLVGALFRNQADNTVREEIIILLTPHIVKDDAAYSKASEEQLRDAEKIRVGTRRGMMPWGRERLAESCYDEAVKEMARSKPDRKRALWHLDCAINLNPKFLEAHRMKEELTGTMLTSSDNSSIRHFLRKQVMAERAPKTAAVDGFATDVAVSIDPTAPTTQPVAEVPTTQPVAETTTEEQPVEDWENDAYVKWLIEEEARMAAEAEAAKGPATQPTPAVTEVPTNEIPSEPTEPAEPSDPSEEPSAEPSAEPAPTQE